MAEKLVRHRIPDIIRNNGQEPITRIAGDDEYPGLLREKLQEEVGEYLNSGRLEELVDILEVVRALAELDDVTPTELEYLRVGKAQARGVFKPGVVWLGNEEGKKE